MKLERNDWKDIWSKFKKGDMKSFQKIYSAFFENLYAYGTKLTSNTSVVEDSIQELFLEIYTNRKNLSDTDYLEYYLLKALRRIIFHKLKKEKRFDSLEDHQSGAFNIDFEVERNNPEDIEQEKIDRIKKSLSQLNPKNREILYLKFYRGLSYQQIGEILDLKPDSAKKQVYRVISKLREDLGSQLLEFFFLCFRA